MNPITVASFTALAAALPSARAQDFVQVPVVATADPQVFRALFSGARQGPGLHALIIGDSQETCPLGQGVLYVPAFNAAWAARYGVSPRTPLVQPGLTFTAPFGEWLASAANLAPSAAPPSANFAQDALPGLALWTVPAPGAGQRGWTLLLQTNATGLSPTLPLDRQRPWLDTSQGVFIDVWALREAGDLAVSVRTAPTDAPTQGGTTLFSAPTSLGQCPDTGPVARQRFGPITWNDQSEGSVQAEFLGADPTLPSRLVSASFVSVAADHGLTATDIAAGGYSAASLVANHSQALPHLRALAADLAFLSFGANDIWYPPAQFKLNTAALIAAIRQSTRQDLPVIILADPARGWSSPAADLNAEAFPRAAAELAAELPAVCAVNSRLLTHRQGWTTASLDPFTADRVHYTPMGARLKADAEVAALWDAFVCTADVGRQGGLPGPDGALDNNDFIVFINFFFAADPAADLGRQGGLSGSDGQWDNNDFIAFINHFFNPPVGC
ncbi:MAG: SGNH/GDSL hydrolase family protein [Phycisphaerales bacterium]|nr:SGNH/GDSL hydrolase family protein [Phycisphaerales bacterium]